MHPEERKAGSQLPQCNLQTGNLRCITSYSLACQRWSCGGPKINSLLQRRAFQNCLAEQPEAWGQGRRKTRGACSEFRHSQENPLYYP
uniref:Macaca fascicularis brain cDNA clone: QtrA-19052, similar to human ankyrin repeat and SOCS box-containing 2 (ASB2), mRNA, RefSeq: NM_016150.3 n=1 Tax=Macaca fascicularis TaxID=9541 RepID=I7GPN9_MACFA|nr:unnamed protein product [Macaca fascicularis]